MASFSLARLFAPALLAAGLGLAALTPSQARADDDLVRVIVGIADVVYHGGHPYYRHGHYGPHDRLIVVRDRYHRPTYYRYAPRVVYYGPPRHAPAYGYYKKPHHHGHYVRYDDRRYRDHDRYDRRDDRRDRRDDDRRHDRRGRGRD